jgi:hypothetical protein
MPWPLRVFEVSLCVGAVLWVGWWMADKQWRYTAMGADDHLVARCALVLAWGSTAAWLTAVVMVACYGPHWVAALWPVYP